MRFLIQILIASFLAFGLTQGVEYIQNNQAVTIPHSNTSLDTVRPMITTGLETQLVEAVANTEPSVVSIIASREIAQYQRSQFGDLFGLDPDSAQSSEGTGVLRQVGGGSGVVINDEGYILTNRHVVDDETLTYEAVFADGSVSSITNVWQDPIIDLAVVKVEPTPTLPTPATFMQRNREVPLGQFTYAIGNALAEYQNSVTLGIISGKDRKIQTMSQDLYVGLYQTDTSISMGNSGGPLYTLDGAVIGINTAVSAAGENIGFAIPVSEEIVDATVRTIKQNGSIVRPFMGIQYIDINPIIAAQRSLPIMQGVSVERVVPDSAADQGGLQAGDLIIALDGLSIGEDTPFLYQLFSYVEGDTVTLSYLRNGVQQKSEIVLGSQ